MREHMGLFRGKRIDNGEWIKGSLWVSGYGVLICERHDLSQWRYVDPDTVGECCGGLRDKNGKLIFEGDIVKCKHSMFRMNAAGFEEQKIRNGYGKEVIPQELGGVRCYYWRNYAFSIFDGQIKLQNGSDFHYAKWAYIYNHDIEIIGTTTDNPELLKGGEGE